VEGLVFERLDLRIDQGHGVSLGLVEKNYRMRKLIGSNHNPVKGFYQ
jgi:hypothetical protein